MIKINVIDFDKTLIPFDSFRLYVMLGLKKLNLRFLVFIILRIFRIINKETFKKAIIKSSNFNSKTIEKFQLFLVGSIDQSLLVNIKQYTNGNTINLLCSSSPHFYISEIAKRINMVGQGSFFSEDKRFYHMYGKKKIDFIKSNYPPESYEYNYAVSDSRTDLDLLSLFKYQLYIEN